MAYFFMNKKEYNLLFLIVNHQSNHHALCFSFFSSLALSDIARESPFGNIMSYSAAYHHRMDSCFYLGRYRLESDVCRPKDE